MNPGKPPDESGQHPLPTSRRSVRLAWVLLVLLVALFYAPILTGLRTFPDGDFNHHFLPFAQYNAHAWRSFSPPLWNPYTYAGHPYWADIQAAVLYPVSTLVLLVTLPFRSDSARLYFLQVEAVLHVLLAGWFTYLFARDLTGRMGPALLGAIAFAFSGYLTGYPPLQLAVLRSAIWLPLVLWLLMCAWFEPGRWRYWVGAALAFATMFLAGHTQTWMYGAYATAGWLVTLGLWSFGRPSRSSSGRAMYRLAGLGAFLLMSAGLVSSQLVPSIEFSRLSVRAAVDYAYVSGGFPLRDSWQLLLPGVLTHFSPLYVGVIPLGLALFALLTLRVQGIRRAESDHVDSHRASFTPYAVIYFVVLTVSALLLSYGDNGFLYPLFYRVLPGWSMFRGQERAAYLVAFGLSILSAYGMSHLSSAPMRVRRRFVLIYGAMVIAVVYGFGLFWQLGDRTAVSHWHYLVIAVVTLLFAMSFSIAVWLEGWNVRREWLLCAFAAINLMMANMSINLTNRSPSEAVALPQEGLALQRAIASSTDATGMKGRAYNEFRLFEDYGMLARVEDVWGSSPLRLSSYALLFEQFPLDRMFRLTGVTHLLSWRRELFEPSEVLGAYPQSEDTTYLHALAEPNARLWVVGHMIVAEDDEAISLLADHDFDLDRAAVLPIGSGHEGWSADVAESTVRAERIKANELHISVSDTGGGVLIASENWMPGWEVRDFECSSPVDCEPGTEHVSGLPLLTPVRANVAFMAIALPQGDVDFRLAYVPTSVRVGSIISAATLLLIVLAVVLKLTAWRATRSG